MKKTKEEEEEERKTRSLFFFEEKERKKKSQNLNTNLNNNARNAHSLEEVQERICVKIHLIRLKIWKKNILPEIYHLIL